MKYALGEIIFERDFEVHETDENINHIKLLVGKPQLDPESSEPTLWYCPHQIVGIIKDRVFIVRGLDPLEALLNTLMMANTNINAYSRGSRKKITWEGKNNLGLPREYSLDM